MFTVIMAWVNSKYDTKYEYVFGATFIIDMYIIINILPLILS